MFAVVQPQEQLFRRYTGERINFHVTATDPENTVAIYVRSTFAGFGHLHPKKKALREWNDRALIQDDNDPLEWTGNFLLTHPGTFQFTIYALNKNGQQHWLGNNRNCIVHSSLYRHSNGIYCAFTRMFGPDKTKSSQDFENNGALKSLEAAGYEIIPPSGTLRDLTASLDHIFDDIGCRILHLLPIHPTPTTHARYGRFGSPYAALDFFSIDPALIEHDKASTAWDQFQELVIGVHQRNGRLLLDIAINHTGWNSTLFNQHSDWFEQNDDGTFHSPGAWGNTWEDLVELDFSHPPLWAYMAKVFKFWCQHGADGFRLDAGYMIPKKAWTSIIREVRHDYPHCVFLLEGLGGSWDTTEELLAETGMQWAYSELFQNYSSQAIAHYQHYSESHNNRGLFVHYSETHDNDRLAKKGKKWSLFRNRLCALLSHNGAFGFSAGVEWLADDQLFVHHNQSLNWGADDNIVAELHSCFDLLTEHSAFHEGAQCRQLFPVKDLNGPLIFERKDKHGENICYIIANPHEDRTCSLEELSIQIHELPKTLWNALKHSPTDLLGQSNDILKPHPKGGQQLAIGPLEIRCYGDETHSKTIFPAQESIALVMDICRYYQQPENPAPLNSEALAQIWQENPHGVLAYLHAWYEDDAIAEQLLSSDEIATTTFNNLAPASLHINAHNESRIVAVPETLWCLIYHERPFCLRGVQNNKLMRKSVPTQNGHAVLLEPGSLHNDVGDVIFRCLTPDSSTDIYLRPCTAKSQVPARPHSENTILLTNDRGGMLHLPVDLGRIHSKYDALLAANLHPQLPEDRMVFAKRIRLWLRKKHFLAPLRYRYLENFTQINRHSARWIFCVALPDNDEEKIALTISMPSGCNGLHIQAQRLIENKNITHAELLIRFDLEHRHFHTETHLHDSLQKRWYAAYQQNKDGFIWKPKQDHELCAQWPGAEFIEDEEKHHLKHPFEATRGQIDHGDCWSPGVFVVSLPDDKAQSGQLFVREKNVDEPSVDIPEQIQEKTLREIMQESVRSFVVRRDDGHSVIAGYPWFLDWGRDTLICARGMMSAGLDDDVRGLLTIFGRFEEDGTLPNCIFGADASNRDTSDAPLWYAVVAEEFHQNRDKNIYTTAVDDNGKTIADVLRNIACGMIKGTPTGIRVDEESGLAWSPSHFTWMDTNYPAGTPRKGFPLEIQALFWRLQRSLAQMNAEPYENMSWTKRAKQTQESLKKYYWDEDLAYLRDCLHSDKFCPATKATPDNALRCNAVMAISLGLFLDDEHIDIARATVRATEQYLLIPGALRSLAPLKISPPLAVKGQHGQLLNIPEYPYWPYYEGDEDSRRKPAYHNGTGWSWPFPHFCEAYARCWPQSKHALKTAQDYLMSCQDSLSDGCWMQMPEVCDGDAPHQQRGCDAQAWGITEVLRVYDLLGLKN